MLTKHLLWITTQLIVGAMQLAVSRKILTKNELLIKFTLISICVKEYAYYDNHWFTGTENIRIMNCFTYILHAKKVMPVYY